jgi:hypothetical protein
MKINEMTVVFLVKLAILEVTSERDNGIFATQAVVRQNPAKRASGWALEMPNIIATPIKLTVTSVLAAGKSHTSFTAAAGTREAFEAAVRSGRGSRWWGGGVCLMRGLWAV